MRLEMRGNKDKRVVFFDMDFVDYPKAFQFIQIAI
jgi:hypothetical protein